VLGFAHFLQLGLESTSGLTETLTKPKGLSLQLVLAEIPEPFLVAVDLVHDRLNTLALSVEAGAEDRCHQCLDHSASKYNWCAMMYSATRSGTQ
jgi:hypothetical protein